MGKSLYKYEYYKKWEIKYVRKYPVAIATCTFHLPFTYPYELTEEKIRKYWKDKYGKAIIIFDYPDTDMYRYKLPQNSLFVLECYFKNYDKIDIRNSLDKIEEIVNNEKDNERRIEEFEEE